MDGTRKMNEERRNEYKISVKKLVERDSLEQKNHRCKDN
jgi:hypothetical protein